MTEVSEMAPPTAFVTLHQAALIGSLLMSHRSHTSLVACIRTRPRSRSPHLGENGQLNCFRDLS